MPACAATLKFERRFQKANPMIVIYETYAIGKTHVPFNAGLIQTASLAFPTHVVRFYAHPSHLEEVMNYMGAETAARIDFREFPIPDRAAAYLPYAWQSYRSFEKIEKETPPGSLLLLSSTIPASLIAAKIYMRLRRHFCGAQLVLHGQLSEIAGWRSRNPFMRLFDFTTALASLNTPRLRYLVLESSIQKELTRLMPGLVSFIDILPHPLPGDKVGEIAEMSRDEPITIGYLGLVSTQKGFYIFRDIARAVKKAAGAKARFITAGHTQGNPLPEDIDCLDVKPRTGYLSREDFSRLTSECHFICLPFFGPHYLLSPSGTLLDAIAAKKPLLALNIPVVKALFDEFGDIGLISETAEEMEAAIIDLVKSPDPTRYEQQCRRIADVLKSRTPEHLAGTYRAITKVFLAP